MKLQELRDMVQDLSDKELMDLANIYNLHDLETDRRARKKLEAVRAEQERRREQNQFTT